MMIQRPIQLLGTSEIENLQRALINLSVATQRPAINTKITGTIDDETMTAVSASLGLLTEQLPSWLYLGLQAAMIVGATNSTAKKYVGDYATQLTLAVNAAAVKFRANPTMTLPTVMQPSGFFPAGWYKTPLGIVAIAVGLFVGYKILFAASTKA